MIIVLNDIIDGVFNRLGDLVMVSSACCYEKLVDLIVNADKVLN